MSENEKIIFSILEDFVILLQRHLPTRILKSKEFSDIKEKLNNLNLKK